jgi:hypothetical protein
MSSVFSVNCIYFLYISQNVWTWCLSTHVHMHPLFEMHFKNISKYQKKYKKVS